MKTVCRVLDSAPVSAQKAAATAATLDAAVSNQGGPCIGEGIAFVSARRYRQGHCDLVQEQLAEETPIALSFNGINHAVMLASPLDLEDFALGFGISEGLLSGPRELYGVEVEAGAHGINVNLEVGAACEWRLKGKKRSLAGRSGCGLCGVESLAQLLPPLRDAPQQLFTPSAILRAVHAMRGQQVLQAATGSTHAAGFANAKGNLIALREDIGRHNALDKLIGHLLHQGVDPSHGFVCVTSRASMEMVQKTLMLGASALAAISAPTSMAVDLARKHRLALTAFVREQNLVTYAEPERIGLLNAVNKT